MNSRTSRLSAAGGSILLMVALAVGVTSPADTVPADTVPADGRDDSSDSSGSQSGVPDDFPGYTGVAEPGTSLDPEKKDQEKQEDFGPIGRQAAHATDVPGQQVDRSTSDTEAAAVPSDEAVGDSAASLRRDVRADGRVRVIVTMNMDVELEADLGRRGVTAQRREIADRLATLDQTLAGTRSRVLTRFTVVPAAVAVLNPAGLERLLGSGRVAALTIDRPAPMALDVSTSVIGSDLLNLAGVLGNDYDGSTGGGPYEVAILDSGVDNEHNAFTGRIVAQACFSVNANCPNGGTSQIGGNAGDNCTFSTQCDHGTHVAGIASGAQFTGGHEGVARGSRITAVQIGSNISGQWRYFFSDLDLALQHVLNLRNGGRRIIAVNLSLGGPLHSTEATCGAAFPNTENLTANLVAAGTAVIAAAGNDGSGTAVSYPGCLPSTLTVAASDDSDVPAGFSNNNAITDWWAPGVDIDAPVTTSPDAHGLKSGTSMATPHVVGAMALLRECVDGNGVPQTLASAVDDLNNTGPFITHDGVSRRRINVLDAATRNVNNNDFASPEVVPAMNVGATPHNDFDFNICADAEPDEPGPFSLDNSIWWTWTPTQTGTATISTEDGGGFVTTFDTTLAVYTGSTLTGLTVVGADDDSGTGLRSLVVMPVNAGTTYRIKVDGFGAANGLLNLHVELGAPPTCGGVPATLVGTSAADTITGTAGSDVIVAGDGDDQISGLAGDDWICTGAGTDTIDGNDGNDSAFGGPGADNIRGGPGNDLLLGNAGGGDNDDVGDTIVGGPGDDLLDGWVGDDLLLGGPGNDQLRGEAGIDTVNYNASTAGVVANLSSSTATGEGSDTLVAVENLVGSGHADTLVGNGQANQLFGRGGDDLVNGHGGNDEIRGEAGDDRLGGHGQDDVLNGGPDNDTALFETSPTGVTASLAAGTATGNGTDTLVAVENLVGSGHADTLVGTGLANQLFGRGGDDTLNGLAGNDEIRGEAGDDRLRGYGQNDLLSGGTDNDTAIFDTSPAGVTASLAAGTATGDGSDTLLAVENLVGSDFNDTLTGNASANQLFGHGGDDTLNGLAGNDEIRGEAGEDRIRGYGHNDILNGGPDNDTALFDTSPAGVTADLAAGTATGDGSDTMVAVENLVGSEFDDTLLGNGIANELFGRGGDDTLSGFSGDDLLLGELGNDSLTGGPQNDTCHGGLGTDTQNTCETISGVP